MAAVADLHLIAVFVGWFVLNIGLSYYNSYVLSHTNFRYAFLLTLINKVVGFFVAITLMLVRRGLPKPGEVLGQFLRPMVHVQGVMTALNIGLNNWSLVFISLTMNQVLRSTVPLPTAALSMLLEGKYFSWHLWASMLLLISGCVLAAWGAMGNEPILGILVALGSVFATAMWTVTSAILMQTGAKPLDSVSLLFVAGPTCMVTLGIFFCVQDLPRLANFQPDPEHPVPPVHMMVLYLGVAAAMASAYDIVHNEFVKITSSLNMAIMGNSKLLILVLLSMLTLETPPTALRIAGVAISFVSIVWYSVFKLMEKAKLKEEGKSEETGKQEGDKTAPLVEADSLEKGKKATESTSLLVGK